MTDPDDLVAEFLAFTARRAEQLGLDWYDRNGEPISMMRWAELHRDYDYVVVAKATVGPCEVSTVWLGLNHDHLGLGPPLIFETMIFGGPEDLEQWRYPTEAEALAGHEDVVAQMRAHYEPANNPEDPR